jgi:hypothetical protein
MAKAQNNIYRRQGIYGSPLPSGLKDLKAPENPEIVTPDISKRSGGAIEPKEAGTQNDDLLS